MRAGEWILRPALSLSFLHFDPHLVLAAIRERGHEFPDSFGETRSRAQVEVPLPGGGIGHPELVSGCAASVGVASMTASVVVEEENLIAWSVWIPVAIGAPPQASRNLMGMVLPSLKARNGSAKLPPVASAPPIGGRNPVKPNVPRVIEKEQVAMFPEVSVAVQLTIVVPIGNKEPEGGLHTKVEPGQLSKATGAG